ncbi:MAG: PDZ domain-containing protein [Gammaproteobacteria bacterium]|nr:PDZ domain-containing protein [Gammaproteobacteria bacterium]
MIKLAAYLLVGVGIGAGIVWWQGGADSVDDWGSGLSVEDRAPLERRLSELETDLALERYERQLLADELALLRDSLETNDAASDDAALAAELRQRIGALRGGDEGQFAETIRERFETRRDGFSEEARTQRQLDRYVEAGLSPERAQWIMQREDELQMEVLQAVYEARQNGATAQELDNLSMSAMMRQELGDADYEKYLEGRGRPTAVNVREVLTNSPAQAAGLRAGDQIIAYDGKRIFEMNELNSLTYEGRPGETVAIDIVRDGQQMQLYVERGPIGVSGGGRTRTRR